MATSKPSVMAYLHPELYKRLNEFKQKRNIQSLSQAVEVILGEYFSEPLYSEPTKFHQFNCNLLQQQTLLTDALFQLNQNYLLLYQEVTILQSSISLIKSLQPSQPQTPKLKIQPTGLELDELNTQQGYSKAVASNSIQLAMEVVEQGLTGVLLASRLRTNSANLSRKRSKEDFCHWSKQLDPDGIAWEYRAFTRRFHPVTLP